MARLSANFSRFVTLFVVAVHLVLLPALYYGLGYVVRKSHEDLFVQHARTFARVIADQFEVGAALDSPTTTADLLDLAIIHGEGRFAELADGRRRVRSALGSPGISAARRTDLRFGQGGDGTYFVVLPIARPGHTAELRLGFDEEPTAAHIRLALNRMLMVLAAYLAVAVAVSTYFSLRLSRPIRRLQDVSRAIASGDYARPLNLSSSIRELHDLAADMEAMRRELVGVNERLQQKIREKEASEARREELEKQVRHRQRLETVGTLAGGIAHEFNNVLVPILLFTEAAMQDLPTDSISRSDLERVMASARRAKNVVQKILTFSRALGDTHLAPTDLRIVVAESVVLFSALAPPSIEIRTEIEDDVPLVQADATLVGDVLMNLLNNGYQAMQGGAGVLTAGLRSGSSGVELRVSDTGHGMDQATADRIFEPFFTTRPIGQGTGLGLAVVHGIVESFGARITVESAPGAGSTFRVVFPASEAAVGRSATRPA